MAARAMTGRLALESARGLVDSHRGLSIAGETDGVIVVVGPYSLYAEHDDVVLAEEYGLRIEIPPDFPHRPPAVFETTGKIPEGYEHKYENGALCLGVDGEIAEALERDPSLSRFLDTFVRDALYSAKFFGRYGRYPFGDRPHGADGILEFYTERYGVDEDGAVGIMECIATGKYRGHLECPCGSGLRGRDCHGPEIIDAIRSPIRRRTAADDLRRVTREHELRRALALSAKTLGVAGTRRPA